MTQQNLHLGAVQSFKQIERPLNNDHYHIEEYPLPDVMASFQVWNTLGVIVKSSNFAIEFQDLVVHHIRTS